MRKSRPISWLKAARKNYEDFPTGAQVEVERALAMVAEGRYPDIAKPMKGFGPGIFELALRYRTDAFRLVYAVRIGDEIWVLHAFQKKSKSGVKTPQHEIELVRRRLQHLKERLDVR